ncbi:MAG TPA: hypothetical protein VJ953_09195 [Saprospiraceae bacterium]|nr:hypothetical protein [Saprospiraceae bacterium]
MRKLTFVVLLLTAFSLQSCLNIVEKLSLNRDGSGTYAITYDMSAMMTGMMREMMLESLQEDEDSPFANAKVDGKIELDTLLNLEDAPMTADVEGEMPPIMRKAKMRMNISETQNLFEATMTLDFDDIGDVEEFQAAMAKMGDDGDSGGFGGMAPMTGLFKLDGRTLMRGESKAEPEAMDDENAEMMKMMMSEATYKTIYEFPRKVKSFDIDGAEKTNKKTLTATYSLIDVMEGKVDMSGKIKFK